MDLAAAGQISVAEAADLTAATLNTFNLDASQSAKLWNISAVVANASSADIKDLALAFSCTPKAKSLISAEDALAAAAKMSATSAYWLASRLKVLSVDDANSAASAAHFAPPPPKSMTPEMESMTCSESTPLPQPYHFRRFTRREHGHFSAPEL